jgi:ankyrin repeat protein
MYTPPLKQKPSSPKNLSTSFTAPNSTAAKIGRKNYFIDDDDDDDDIYSFKTPIKQNVNVALEVEASSTFRSRSMQAKPPPPPASPTAKGHHNSFFYSLDNDDDDDAGLETNGFESSSNIQNDEEVKFLKVKGGSPLMRKSSNSNLHNNSSGRSLAKRGMSSNTKDILKCPRCGKQDFDSKAIYNSHARNCKREPGSPKNKPKITASPGFGRMGLLLQIRRLQEEEERKKAEELERKQREEAEAKLREEEQRKIALLKIEEEKKKAIEAARIAQALAEEKLKKRDKFINDVEEAAKARNYNQLKQLLDSAKDHDIDPNHIVISQATDVLEQLKELEDLRLKVEAARKEKEDKERLAREEEERIINERKKRLLDFELMEEENDSNSDDENTKQRRLQRQKEFEEKKRRRDRRKGLRRGGNNDNNSNNKKAFNDIKANEMKIANELNKEYQRDEKIQSTKAEIEAEKSKIAELTRIIQLEKEMSRKAESKEIELQKKATEEARLLLQKKMEMEKHINAEKAKLDNDKKLAHHQILKKKLDLEKELKKAKDNFEAETKARVAEIEKESRNAQEKVEKEKQKLFAEKKKMEDQILEQKRAILKEKKMMEDEKLKLQLVKDETLNKIKLEKEQVETQVKQYNEELTKMEEKAKQHEKELKNKEKEIIMKAKSEAEKKVKKLENDAREEMERVAKLQEEKLLQLEEEKRIQMQEEAKILREKQTAHEMAEKFALEQAEKSRQELARKMKELETRDSQRRKHVQDEILKYREQARIKLKQKEDVLNVKLEKKRAELDEQEKLASTGQLEMLKRFEEEKMKLKQLRKEDNLRRKQEEVEHAKRAEEAKKAADVAMKRLEEREKQLKLWEEEMITKAKDEAARISNEAKNQVNDAKELERQIIGDATKEAAERAAKFFDLREAEFKKKEEELKAKMEQNSLNIEKEKIAHQSQLQEQQQLMFKQLQDQINRMEERDQELRLREEKLRTEEAVAKQKQKLLEEKEKLYKILHAEKKEESIPDEQQQQQYDNANYDNQCESYDKQYNNQYDDSHNQQADEQSGKEPMSMIDYLRQFFKPLDYEGDGFIKNEDFRNALMSLPQPPSDDVAQQLIQSMDKNSIGKVNYEEFIQYYVSEMDEEELAQAMQQDGSGNYENNAEDYPSEGYGSIPCSYCQDTESGLATHYAASYGHTECLEALIANGANMEQLDRSSRTALFCAAANNHFNCVAVLLDGIRPEALNHQDIRGDSALHASCCNGNHECAQIILQSGAEPDLQNNKGHTPAHLCKTAECMQFLYERGGDLFCLDGNERTALFTACAHGRHAIVSLILEIDEESTMLDFVDVRGDTPLHGAACNGHSDVVKLLLQTAADPSIKNRMGFTAGYLAECNGHMEACKLLEEYGGYIREGLQPDSTNTEAAGGKQREYDLSNWSHAQDPESGHYYYYHVETGETQWEEPPGYSAYITQNGQQQQTSSGDGTNEGYDENYDYYNNNGEYDNWYDYWNGYYGDDNQWRGYSEEGYYEEGYDNQTQQHNNQQQQQQPQGIKYNKDYMKMVEEYTAQMPYRKPAAGYDEVPTCIICHERPARDVFLPCEHTCVCKGCIETYGYKGKRDENDWKPKQCPVCKRRAYKVVALSKYLTLPKDYGPAPKLSQEWIDVFKKSSKMLSGERTSYDDSNVLDNIFKNKE